MYSRSSHPLSSAREERSSETLSGSPPNLGTKISLQSPYLINRINSHNYLSQLCNVINHCTFTNQFKLSLSSNQYSNYIYALISLVFWYIDCKMRSQFSFSTHQLHAIQFNLIPPYIYIQHYLHLSDNPIFLVDRSRIAISVYYSI